MRGLIPVSPFFARRRNKNKSCKMLSGKDENMKSRVVSVLVVLTSAISLAAAAEQPSNLLTNGGFEFWAHYGIEKLPEMVANGPNFGNGDPLVPVRWSWSMRKPAYMSRSGEAHSGKYGVSIISPKEAAEAELSLAYLEVVPGETYFFGVWARGTGKIVVKTFGQAVEGAQVLASANGNALPSWRHIEGEVTIPGHIRLLTLVIIVMPGANVVVDDAHISATLDFPHDPDVVLREKQTRDKKTILLADFESALPEVRLSHGGCLTDSSAGRFGRALEVARETDLATIDLRLPEMPKEGTLEFWLSPNSTPQLLPENPEKMLCFLMIHSATQNLAWLQANPDVLYWGWRITGETYGKGNYVEAPGAISIYRMRKGEWTHVAITWDSAAVRLYVDGVLAGMQTEPPVNWFAPPLNLTIGSHYMHSRWEGLIDEIRLSKVKRYGPFVPKGAKPMPLRMAKFNPVQPPAEEEAKPDIDYTAERKRLIGAIEPTRPGLFESRSTPDGGYVYEVTSAHSLVSDSGLQLESDTVAPGLTTAWIDDEKHLFGAPDSKGLYWRLGAIRPGRYWLGLVYESQREECEAPWTPWLGIYLSGRYVQCSTTSNPVQVAPGAWFSEIQSAQAEALKPEDDISVVLRGRRLRIARLLLHRKQPRRGTHRFGTNYGGHWSSLFTNLMVHAEALFLDRKGEPLPFPTGVSLEQSAASPDDLLRNPEGNPVVRCRLLNPLPVEVTINYEAVIKGYYRQVAGRDSAKITLPPHSAITRQVPFALNADDPSYSIEVTGEAINPPNLGWPEVDTVSFFPGVRQSVPWLDPFSFRERRRMYFATSPPGERQRICLNGDWELALTTELEPQMPPPANLKFEPRTIPFPYWALPLDSITPRPHGAYLRRTFELPAETTSRSYRLVISDVVDEATAYINGVKVGNLRGGYTPLMVDITQAVRPGRNELVVVLRDLLALMDPAYISRHSPTPSGQYLDAPGLYGFNYLALGFVSLEAAPKVAASEILVMSSVRKKSLGARIEISNRTDESVRALVAASVLGAGKPVFELGSKEVNLAAGESAKFILEKPWENPLLWSPDDPHLYTLAVETKASETGKRLDLARERFGFRECWLQGNHIYFNGFPVKLKGSGTPYAIGTGIDAQMSRTPHHLYDYLDEFGHMTTWWLAAVMNTPSQHNVESEKFWETARRNAMEGAKRLQNHPSIIAWMLSNEWFCYLESNPEKGAKQLHTLTDALAQQDPTRWTYYSADEDLRGLHYNFSFHYMQRWYPTFGFGIDGHSCYFPDGAFWRPLERDFKPGEEIIINPFRRTSIRWGEKVVMDTENLNKAGYFMPPGLTKFADEEDVISSAVDSAAGPIVWMWKQNLDAHRDLGVNYISIYGATTGALRRGFVLQTFILPDMIHHGFSGAPFCYRYSLHNDIFRPAEFALRWRLLTPDGKPVAHGEDIRAMGTGDLQRGLLSFQLPEVKQRTTYTLDLRLEADGKFVHGEQRDLEVWPTRPVHVGPLGRRLLLFDPKGQTAAALKAAGVRCQTVGILTPPPGDPEELVFVVGESALSEENAAAVTRLQEFVAAGGRMIILAQSVSPVGLPAVTKLEPREWVSQPFVRVSNHPILEGITCWDLHFWAPARVSARGAYTKPEGGAATPLVDSGTDMGLEWVQMMEMYRGEGLYLLCQFPLISAYDAEPMAREMLARILHYVASQQSYRRPTRQMQVITQPESAIERRLRELSIRYERVTPKAPVGPDSVVLVDARAKATDIQREGWAQALRAGATLVVCGAEPGDAVWLSALAGRPVRITVQPYRMWEGRGYRNGFTQPVAGISQVDLYWKRYTGDEGAWAQAEDPTYTIEPLHSFSVHADGAEELVFSGALVEMRLGEGRLLIDERRWMTTNDELTRKANRLVCALALGLNVGIAPAPMARELPRNISYHPIDQI